MHVILFTFNCEIRNVKTSPTLINFMEMYMKYACLFKSCIDIWCFNTVYVIVLGYYCMALYLYYNKLFYLCKSLNIKKNVFLNHYFFLNVYLNVLLSLCKFDK